MNKHCIVDDELEGAAKSYIGTWLQECAPAQWEVASGRNEVVDIGSMYETTSWRMRELTIESDGGFTMEGKDYDNDECTGEGSHASEDSGKFEFGARRYDGGDPDGFELVASIDGEDHKQDEEGYPMSYITVEGTAFVKQD